MRKGILISLVALALHNSLARAQHADTDRGHLPLAVLSGVEECGPTTLWGEVDYLLLWTRNAPLAFPLVTTGSPTDAQPGAIGQPGTHTLYGGEGINMGPSSGTKLTLGAYLDSNRYISLEGSGFWLPTAERHFSATSGDDGNPLLAFPFYNKTPGSNGESAYQISNPASVGAPLTGNVQIVSSLELWGADVNYGFCLYRCSGFQWTLLVGGRYMGLRESLSINSASADYATTPIANYSQNDTFETENQFYGGQIGTRIQWQFGRFTGEITGKCAAGLTHEVVNTFGSFEETSPTAISLQHGFFTEPSNIGQQAGNAFSIVPSAHMQFGYQITRNLRAVVGYDFLYWNAVVRPGNQIDRNVNTSQNAAFNFGGVLNGPANPAPLFVRSDFWAQGLNVGLAWCF